MITLNNISKIYGLNAVLRGVSLAIGEGEFVTLVGPNGAGKSTLLRIIATLIQPTAGEVTVGGWSLQGQADRVRRYLGYISHQSLLYDDLTAEENLHFFARLYGVTDGRQTVESALRQFDLFERRRDFVRTFSRGMTQRLTIARATLHDPAVLLLDEPYTGLDREATDVLDKALKNFRADGRTILLVTHDLLHGWRLADRAVILRRGRLVGEQNRDSMDDEAFMAFYREQISR